MPKELTWKKAIDKVFAASSQPFHYQEITERIISDGLRTRLGATPAATVNAQIAVSIKKHGDDSPHVRVAKGMFPLSKKAPTPSLTSRPKPKRTQEDDEEEQDEIVSSFGMFCRGEGIEWGGYS